MTHPGLTHIWGATAVELLTALLYSPEGGSNQFSPVAEEGGIVSVVFGPVPATGISSEVHKYDTDGARV